MGAKQSNPLYPSRALRADPSADDSSVGEDNLTPPGGHNGWNIEMKSAKSPEDTRRLFRALIACRPRAVRRRVGGRGNEWFDEELSERRVSYESAVPELPAVAVSREPDASINSDLAGNDAVCSTCPSRPSP